MQFPDYSNSLLALGSSIRAHFGLNTHHSTLTALDTMLEWRPRNVVVMLFDGMGTAILEKHLPADAFLRRHLHGSISSVFPPTTTAATISLESGLAPICHGWLGWRLYFAELDQTVNLFPNTVADHSGRKAGEVHIARTRMPYHDTTDEIRRSGRYDAAYLSPYAPDAADRCKTLDELFDAVRARCAMPEEKYVYAYWPQPDYDMHEFGTADERITAQLTAINAAIEALASTLRDTLLIVTADHGMIDTEWRYLSDYPDLASCLARQISIEARAASFFIKPGKLDDFARKFKAVFGDSYRLFTHDEVLQSQLFGAGTPHPLSDGFIGDYLAVATGSVSLDMVRPDESDFVMRAVHAGATPEELNIPFIAVEC